MGTPSPKYTAEFKRKAVELYKKSGTTYAEVAHRRRKQRLGTQHLANFKILQQSLGANPVRILTERHTDQGTRVRTGAVLVPMWMEPPASS